MKKDVITTKNWFRKNHFVNGRFLFKFGCCGVKSYEDWYMIDAWPDEKWVPDSCCLPANFDANCGKIRDGAIYTQGCYAQINNFFIRRLDIIGFVGILIAFFQVSIFLLCNLLI